MRKKTVWHSSFNYVVYPNHNNTCTTVSKISTSVYVIYIVQCYTLSVYRMLSLYLYCSMLFTQSIQTAARFTLWISSVIDWFADETGTRPVWWPIEWVINCLGLFGQGHQKIKINACLGSFGHGHQKFKVNACHRLFGQGHQKFKVNACLGSFGHGYQNVQKEAFLIIRIS